MGLVDADGSVGIAHSEVIEEPENYREPHNYHESVLYLCEVRWQATCDVTCGYYTGDQPKLCNTSRGLSQGRKLAVK